MKFFVSTTISTMLKEIQTGGAKVIEDKYIKKYGMENVNSNDLSFSEHIERTIEMFVS